MMERLPCLPRPESKKGQGKEPWSSPEGRNKPSYRPTASVSIILRKGEAPATNFIYVALILAHFT